MKVLFVTSVIPYPPNNGIRVVPYNAMKILVENNHSVLLCALTNETETGVEGMTLEQRFSELSDLIAPESFWMKTNPTSSFKRLLNSFGLLPSFIKEYRHAKFRENLCSSILYFQPDAIHFDFINTTEYLSMAPAHTKTIASINDSMSLAMENRLRTLNVSLFYRIAKKLQLIQIKCYEKHQYPKFDKIHLMTDVDAEYLKRLNPATETAVIPNGVDPILFDLNFSTPEIPTVIFVGELKGNNLDAVRSFVSDAWPKVLVRVPQARLRLVGGVSATSRLWIESLSKELNISSIGYVDKLSDIYKDATFSIAPINKDSGIMNKIIESMAACVPVIGFGRSFLAIKHAKKNVHFIAGDNLDEIAEKLAASLLDHRMREQLANNGRGLAIVNYSWSSKVDEYIRLYRQA